MSGSSSRPSSSQSLKSIIESKVSPLQPAKAAAESPLPRGRLGGWNRGARGIRQWTQRSWQVAAPSTGRIGETCETCQGRIAGWP